MTRVYLAGPMTGIPQMNFPAFDAAAADLRARGWEVVSPAELDSPESRAAALAAVDGDLSAYSAETGETWGDLLARDVKLIADGGIEAIVVLPGWEESRGARLESFVGRLCDIHTYTYPDGLPAALPPGDGWYTKPVDLALGVAGNVVFGHDEVRVVNETTGGEKGAKPQAMHLLPWGAVLAISEVYDMGAKKYDAHNWRRGYDWSLSFAALMRHLALWWEEEDTDEESGLSHLAHAAFHILTLLTFAAEPRYEGLDDRPKVA